MAHDSQVPQELPEELRERSKDSQPLTSKVSASLELLADWWALYGQIYKDDPTDALAEAFRTILKPLLSKPEILNQALIIAARQSPEFRPKPGWIFEIAETIMVRRQQMPGNRPKYLDAPKLSEAEREAAIREFPLKLRGGTRIDYEAMKKTGIGLPHKKPEASGETQ